MQIFTKVSVKNSLPEDSDGSKAEACGEPVAKGALHAQCIGLGVEEAEAAKCYVEMILCYQAQGMTAYKSKNKVLCGFFFTVK